MQTVSADYKLDMRKSLRNRSFMSVSIGVVNQLAQANAKVYRDNLCYLSDYEKPFLNYDFEAYYATAELNFAKIDGSMYFAPPEDRPELIALNQGFVSETRGGYIEIQFDKPYRIKAFTIDFGDGFPTHFECEYGTLYYDPDTGQSISAISHFEEFRVKKHYVKEISEDVTFIRIFNSFSTNRLRILKFTAGLGITFDNKTIKSASQKEFVHPTSEELPTIDFSLTVDNYGQIYDIENDKSTLNYFETGQEVSVSYGYELDKGKVEWLQGATLDLSTWKADDKTLTITAVDRWGRLQETFYKGRLYASGITAYNLAEIVFADAEIDSGNYEIDEYLESVILYNPLPICTHAAALQLIANASRCVLYQDRDGNYHIKHSFSSQRLPRLSAYAETEHWLSSAGNIVNNAPKIHYAIANDDYAKLADTSYFRPETENQKLYTGYISEELSDSDGLFLSNLATEDGEDILTEASETIEAGDGTIPKVIITLEASYVSYGITLNFNRNCPQKAVFNTYLNNSLVENYTADISENSQVIDHEFSEFDKMVIEFPVAHPYSHVYLDDVVFGQSTDYYLSKATELSAAPIGEQTEKIKQVKQIIYTYQETSEETKEIFKESRDFTGTSTYTATFNSPCYDYAATIDGASAIIKDSGAYFVEITIPEGTETAELSITGKEFVINTRDYFRTLNDSGTTAVYENPLISNDVLANDIAVWEGDYLYANRGYSLQYRGDPRIDANDVLILENKYVDNCFIRAYEHSLNFNGALSGSIRARRDMAGGS